MVTHFLSPLRTLKKKARGRLHSNNNSWSDFDDDDDEDFIVSEPAKTSVKSDKVTRICICCGSKTTIPPAVACYKCSVCETVNDLHPVECVEKIIENGQLKTKPRIAPPPLTLDRLKAGVHAFRKHPEKQNLLEAMIRESFGNWDVLNVSFPNGNEVSSDDPGISLVEVRTAYKIILGLPPPFIRALMTGTEQILHRPGRRLETRDDIRFLLIIVENPLLLQQNFPQESAYHHHIAKGIIGLLANLPNSVHYSLVLWLTQHTTSSLSRKVALVNQFLSFRLEKYDRARKRNQATQRPVPLTSYSSQSNQTELPAFQQRGRSITHAPTIAGNSQQGFQKRGGDKNRSRAHTHSPGVQSPRDESPSDASTTPGGSGASTPRGIISDIENDPRVIGGIGGSLAARRALKTADQGAQRAGTVGAESSRLWKRPPLNSVHFADSDMQSDFDASESSDIATFGGASATGSINVGLGISGPRGRAPQFPSLSSTPPDASPRSAVENIRQRLAHMDAPSPLRMPEQVKFEPNDRIANKRRSRTVGAYDTDARPTIASLSANPSAVLPAPWSLGKTGSPSSPRSPSNKDLTPPPMAHARDTQTGGIEDMTSGSDTNARLSQYVPLKSSGANKKEPLAPGSPIPLGGRAMNRLRQQTESVYESMMTTFIPMRRTAPDSKPTTQTAPVSRTVFPSPEPKSSVSPFRSMRGPPATSRLRTVSMCIEGYQPPNIGPSASDDAEDQGTSGEPSVRPGRNSLFGVLDGTAEPGSPTGSAKTRSSLTRTRSSSEAPARRRRADAELTVAAGPPVSSLATDWGSGVDFDDYYVGADGIFYPKSSSLVMYQHDWRLVTAAKVMALLHAANLLLSSRSQLPVEAFYVQAVDNMDLIADYDAWRAQYPGAFSFCQYPFLLSLKAKVQIMQVDAARQMHSKVKEAVISALFQSSLSHRANQANQPHLKLLVRRRCLVEDSLHQLASHEQDLKKRLKIEFVGEEGIDAGGLAKEWFMLLVRELMNPMYGMFRRESDDSSVASEENSEWGGAYWFNPASLETSNQYFLVGIVVGLALYNSTILDLHLPLAVFKKLLRTKFYANPTATSTVLAGAKATGNQPPSIVSGTQSQPQTPTTASGNGPSTSAKGKSSGAGKPAAAKTGNKPLAAASGSAGNVAVHAAHGNESSSPIYGLLSASAQIKYQINEMLADVAEFRPQFARGLRQLLAYRGQDVEDVFCLTFEATYSAYGEIVTVPLVPNGSNVPVTSSNRVEYVMRYLQWILNDSISKQFEPFKRGFFYVCGGNALSLFKPEEVELMVHGSDTDWDPKILQKITEYAGFGDYEKMLTGWFWEILNDMAPKERRAFLAFVTGTDRLPMLAAGSQLKLKLVLLGDDFRRLPVAHTCFNQLGIWCYRSKDEFRDKLAMALTESEGFGLQ